jgi:hypothetical protein
MRLMVRTIKILIYSSGKISYPIKTIIEKEMMAMTTR